MPVFDCHTHVFPDAVAQVAVTTISQVSRTEADFDGTRDGLIRRLRDAGCDGALNCPIATKPEQVRSINNWAASANEWPVLSLGTIHPDFPQPAAEIERLHSLGLLGIKLHPEYQQFTLEDPRMDPVWETCAGLGLPLLIHAGKDVGTFPPYRTDPARFANLYERVPGLTLIAAHLGGWQQWDEVETCLAGMPVYFDTAYVVGQMSEEQLLRLIRTHGVHRVLYGTDAPWQNPCTFLQRFLALPLTERERRWILWENAADLFGLTFPGGEAESPAPDADPAIGWQERDRTLLLDDAGLFAACRADAFRGTGRGGQKRNRTSSAIRVTHPASGIAASSDETRSQHKNREIALRLLRWELALAIRNPEPAAEPAAAIPGWRSPEYALWLARALDHLAANGYQVGPAARAVDVSTGHLVHELARYTRIWDTVNQARTEQGLPALTKR
jgi:predicted TIM-barrel fold metal-dependent hydrolase